MDNMMEKHNFNFELETLLMSKAFGYLNQHEKEFVLGQITADEYNRFRAILLASEKIFRDEEIESSNSENIRLMESFDQKYKSGNRQSTVIIGNFILPFYKAAIVAVVLLSSFFLIGWKVSIEMQNQAVIYLTDTIYKKVLVPDRVWLADSSTRIDYYNVGDTGGRWDIIHSIKKLHIPENEKSLKTQIADYETAQRMGIAPDIDFADIRRKKKRGKSLQEDSVLSKLIVGIN
ncbi:MAG: hypothetical protein U9R19_05955 [Bacteroidota bacterium]|nr:hypothetical protein [Bacteroidota bacterium]